jgi:hypothetical protein
VVTSGNLGTNRSEGAEGYEGAEGAVAFERLWGRGRTGADGGGRGLTGADAFYAQRRTASNTFC